MATGNKQNVLYHKPRKSWYRAIFWWARAFITAGLAWFLIYQIRREIDHITLQLVNPIPLLLVIVAAFAAVFISAWVWQLMLPADGRPGYFTLLAHYLLGLFLNNFLPGGFGGDLVRVGALTQDGQRLDTVANSVLMARLVGLWSIVLLASLSAPLYALTTNWQRAFPLTMIALGALAIAFLGTIFLFGAPMTFLVNHLPARWQTWHNQLRSYRENRRVLICAIGLSFSIQFLAVAINFLVAQALGFSIPFAVLLFSIPLINLVALLPISIGGFGVREGAYYYMLGFFGVSAGDAVLLSLAVYIILLLVSAVGAAASQILIPRSSEGKSCIF